MGVFPALVCTPNSHVNVGSVLSWRWLARVSTPTRRIQGKSTTDLAFGELTLSQLQCTCEAILFRPLDKSVFRKQLKDARYSVPTGRMTGEGRLRPTQLYKARESFAWR